LRGEDIPPGKKRFAIAVLICAALAAIVATWRLIGADFDRKRFVEGFRELDIAWLAAGIALILLTYVGRALRWRVMISPIRPEPSLSNLMRATFIGFTAVTLFGRPGELVRPYLIARFERLSVSSQLAVWLLERIYDLLFVILLFGFGLIQVDSRPGLRPALQGVLQTGGYFVAVVGSLCLAVLIAISLFSGPAQRRIRSALEVFPERYRSRADPIVSSFAGGMASTRRATFVLQLILYTLAEWTIIVLATYCLLQSFPPTRHLSIADNSVFLGFVAFGSVIQIPGIGGGFQVAVVFVLTELFGLGLEPAAAAAVLLWITMNVVIVPFGIAVALHEGLSWRFLRHLPEEASEQETTNVVGDGPK
jgi:uncharacterized protein (TIRG00374 family)